MRKRLATLLAVLIMVLACALPAFAATGFDVSLLSGTDGISGNAEDGIFYPESMWNEWYTVSDAADGLVIYPVIVVSENKEVFRLCVNYDYNSNMSSPIDLRDVVFFINDHYYYFPQVGVGGVSYVRDNGETWNMNAAFIDFDVDSFALLDALAQPHSKDVVFFVVGENGTTGFLLDQEQINGILSFYNLYKQAGGLRDVNLSQIASGTGSQFSIVE